MLVNNGHPNSFAYNGQNYDFSHLHPASFTFKLLGGVSMMAECRFKSHCYTRELETSPPESNVGLLRIDDENENERYFCVDRYSLSLNLANWISVWCDQKCIQGKNYKHGVEHWIVVEDDNGKPVKVAFSIEKHDSMPLGLMMWIKTTHHYDRSKPPVATRENSIPFNTLAKTMAHTGKQPQISKPRR